MNLTELIEELTTIRDNIEAEVAPAATHDVEVYVHFKSESYPIEVHYSEEDGNIYITRGSGL